MVVADEGFGFPGLLMSRIVGVTGDRNDSVVVESPAVAGHVGGVNVSRRVALAVAVVTSIFSFVSGTGTLEFSV